MLLDDLLDMSVLDKLNPFEEPSELPKEIPTLEATWWIFEEDKIKNLWECGEDILQEMCDKYKVAPLVISDKKTIFEARYELVKHGEGFKYSEAKLPEVDNPVGWADFLGGFPYGVVEMMALLFEEATENYDAQSGDGAAAPIPKDFFKGYEEKDIAYNLLYLTEKICDPFSDGISGEEKPKGPKWWQRINFEQDYLEKRPTPGEFVCLGIRLFPDKPWGDQEASPFISSGNWFDTLYYTSAKVLEVMEPDENRPFKLYKVGWRAKEEGGITEFLARPSGFEEYEVDDRVAILKDAATTRTSQTWKDDQEFDKEVWRIVPVTFYKKDEQEE